MAKKDAKGPNPFKPRAKSPDDDRSTGLWIDYDLLRRHRERQPQISFDSPMTSSNNRYLELADLALGKTKPKKKANSAAGSE
jgi:hypothetical protein